MSEGIKGQSVKLLVGSDLHGSMSGLDWFVEVAQRYTPDLCVFLGDFVTHEPLHFLKEAAALMRGLAPLGFVVPGNWDPRECMVELDIAGFDGFKHLHKQLALAHGYTFAGLGGSTTTPVGTTPLERVEEGFAGPLAPLLPADIWVLHNPVHGFCDQVHGGIHVGSPSLHALWQEQDVKPLLVLSGHIHEAHGEDRAGGSVFVNPGALKEQRAALVQLAGRNVSVELLIGAD